MVTQGEFEDAKDKVMMGAERRTLVAGIAEAYEPEALVGRVVAMVANLKPATVMGVESNGMVVAASVAGKAVLATFADDVPIGASLR